MSDGTLKDAVRHCIHCPTLCLDSCPVSTVEANDTVSPWGKMNLAALLDSGRIPRSPETTDVLYYCTDCGACQSACKHGVDVSATLRLARKQAVGSASTALRSNSIHTPVEADNASVLPAGVSGVLLREAGFDVAFEQVARAAAGRWSGRTDWIFTSAEDARCAAEIYPAMGLRPSGQIRLPAHGAPVPAVKEATAYYVPPHLRRCDTLGAPALFEKARAALGDHWVVWRGNGAESLCCGATGTFPVVSPGGAANAARRVLRMAKVQGATHVLTACGASAAHLATHATEFQLTVLRWGSESA